ncbi:unnamed protein product [Symbiodinium sp. CCMP2592]|nr:unnamed protein product [Symbiodinium sp. CCMP2592]
MSLGERKYSDGQKHVSEHGFQFDLRFNNLHGVVGLRGNLGKTELRSQKVTHRKTPHVHERLTEGTARHHVLGTYVVDLDQEVSHWKTAHIHERFTESTTKVHVLDKDVVDLDQEVTRGKIVHVDEALTGVTAKAHVLGNDVVDLDQKVAPEKTVHVHETLSGVTAKVHVFGKDVIDLDTGSYRKNTLSTESSSFFETTEISQQFDGIKILGVEFTSLTETVKTNRFGLGNCELVTMETREGRAPTFRPGEDAHMISGAGLAGGLNFGFDMLDGKGTGEALQHGVQTSAGNFAIAAAMKNLSLPCVLVDAEQGHIDMILLNGYAVGLGKSSKFLRTPEGDIWQTDTGIQLGAGVPGDPLQNVQAEVRLGRSETESQSKQSDDSGYEEQHCTSSSEGFQLQLQVCNRATPSATFGSTHKEVRGHGYHQHLDRSITHDDESVSDSFSVGIASWGSFEELDQHVETLNNGGQILQSEQFSAQTWGLHLGLCDGELAQGSFRDEKQELSGSGDVVHETFEGSETRTNSSCFFGLCKGEQHVNKHGHVHRSECHSSSDSSWGITTSSSTSTDEDWERTVCDKQVTDSPVQHKVVQEHTESHLSCGLSLRDHERSVAVGTGNGQQQEDGIDRTWDGSDEYHILNGRQLSCSRIVKAPGVGERHQNNFLFSIETRGRMHFDDILGKVVADDVEVTGMESSAAVKCLILVLVPEMMHGLQKTGQVLRPEALPRIFETFKERAVFGTASGLFSVATGGLHLFPFLRFAEACRKIQEALNSEGPDDEKRAQAGEVLKRLISQEAQALMFIAATSFVPNFATLVACQCVVTSLHESGQAGTQPVTK